MKNILDIMNMQMLILFSMSNIPNDIVSLIDKIHPGLIIKTSS